MSVYSFENKKSVPLRVLSFHFAYGKMKTAISNAIVAIGLKQEQERKIPSYLTSVRVKLANFKSPFQIIPNSHYLQKQRKQQHHGQK